MGHANKGSSSQNNHWWDGEVLTAPYGATANGATGTLVIPDSYGFVMIRPSANTAVVNTIVNNIDTEWFPGRVLEITLQDKATPHIVSFVTANNLLVNTGGQALTRNATISFRAVRDATGAEKWLQIGFQAYSTQA